MRVNRKDQTVSIVQPDASHLEVLAGLACKLWPDNDLDSMRLEFEELLGSDRDAVFLAEKDGRAAGFIHMSLRTDYVEGSDSSPVGYVEGVYVEEEFRNSGIARKLVEAGEQWAKSLGCTQVASDAELDNVQSHVFHQRIGFREANRIVAFIKDIS